MYFILKNASFTNNIGKIDVESGTVTPPSGDGDSGSDSSTINVLNLNDSDLIWGQTTKNGVTDGSFVTDAERGVSGYIAVSSGDKIRGATYRSGQTSADTGNSCYPFKNSPVYFYNSSKTFISSTSSQAFTGSGSDYVLTVPSGVSYIRVMLNYTYKDTNLITINTSLPSTFVAYQAV